MGRHLCVQCYWWCWLQTLQVSLYIAHQQWQHVLKHKPLAKIVIEAATSTTWRLFHSCVQFPCPHLGFVCLPVGRWGSLYRTRPLQSELPPPGQDHGGCLGNRGPGGLCYYLRLRKYWGKSLNVEPRHCRSFCIIPTLPFFLPSLFFVPPLLSPSLLPSSPSL